MKPSKQCISTICGDAFGKVYLIGMLLCDWGYGSCARWRRSRPSSSFKWRQRKRGPTLHRRCVEPPALAQAVGGASVLDRWSQAEVLVLGGLCVLLVQEAVAAKEEVLKLQKHIRAVLWQEEGKGNKATCPL